TGVVSVSVQAIGADGTDRRDVSVEVKPNPMFTALTNTAYEGETISFQFSVLGHYDDAEISGIGLQTNSDLPDSGASGIGTQTVVVNVPSGLATVGPRPATLRLYTNKGTPNERVTEVSVNV